MITFVKKENNIRQFWKLDIYQFYSNFTQFYWPSTAWKVFIYGSSGPNTGKYGPEKTPYLDTFHAVILSGDSPKTKRKLCLYPKMLWKITECEKLGILQEKFYDGVSFSKVVSLHCSDYNFTIKRTHHKFFLE